MGGRGLEGSLYGTGMILPRAGRCLYQDTMGPQGIWKLTLGDTAFRRLLKPGWAPTGLDWASVRGKQMFPV